VDVENKVASQYGLMFTVDQGSVDTLLAIGGDLKLLTRRTRPSSHPATIVTEKRDNTPFVHAKADYANREDPAKVLELGQPQNNHGRTDSGVSPLCLARKCLPGGPHKDCVCAE
jgi:hypothetical protein